MSDYSDSGFDSFLSRSIDNLQQVNLDSQGPYSTATAYDRSQLSGAMGDIYKMGGIKMSAKDSSIVLNNGSIVVDAEGNENSAVKIDGLTSTINIGTTIALDGKTGSVTSTDSTGAKQGMGPMPNNSSENGFFSTDYRGNLIFKIVGATFYVYDITNGTNVMQFGLLPDGTYGWAVAQTGKNVADGFA